MEWQQHLRDSAEAQPRREHLKERCDALQRVRREGLGSGATWDTAEVTRHRLAHAAATAAGVMLLDSTPIVEAARLGASSLPAVPRRRPRVATAAAEDEGTAVAPPQPPTAMTGVKRRGPEEEGAEAGEPDTVLDVTERTAVGATGAVRRRVCLRACIAFVWCGPGSQCP